MIRKMIVTTACLSMLLVPAANAESLALQVKQARQIFTSDGKPVVSVQVTRAGRDDLARFTRENVGKQVSVELDGKVLASPFIQTPIVSDTLILGLGLDLDAAKATQIAVRIRGGGTLMINDEPK